MNSILSFYPFQKQIFKILWIVVFSIFITSCQNKALKINIQCNQNQAPVQHGIAQLKTLQNVQFVAAGFDYTITTELDSIKLAPEAYSIEVNKTQVKVTGGDAVGLMYALLDIKEQLTSNTQKIEPKNETPALAFRALKFNLPWDSYRNGEALALHYETCRDTNFWHDFLDMMAENRFNKLTLWNLHPFNYMVKTAKYPEACGFSDAEMEEWELFWHSLFRMAKNRGIETYLINWNIFVSPEFAKAHNASPISIENNFLGEGDTTEIMKDYFRESVRDVIDTYPNLTGLGITLGEGMGGMTPEEREQWLLDSYIAGVRKASRKIKFIHRVPLSAGKGSGGSTSASVEVMTRETLDTLTCFDGPINIELKFNWSHGHSCTDLVKVHGGKLSDAYWNPLPKNYYLAWMMRNEDFFVLRWGQPDFIRSHIEKNLHPYVNGYYVGSETYIPAKDYITSLPGSSYHYAFERQWMFYKMWGHLLYNAQTPDAYFAQAFENRFPGKGNLLFDAQSEVSKIPLIIASYWNATWDFTLYSEGMLGFNDWKKPSVDLLSLKTLSTREPMDPNYMSIPEFLADETASTNKISPIALADSIDEFCFKALSQVKSIDISQNVDLLNEVSDIKAWAYLGCYFSNKLRAAVEYQKFKQTNNADNLKKAIEWLEKATKNWDDLVNVTTPIYEPMPLMHNTFRNNKNDLFHWSMVQKQVNDELAWLKSLQ